ncbi:ISL3 family transposase [Embleya hyalina]
MWPSAAGPVPDSPRTWTYVPNATRIVRRPRTLPDPPRSSVRIPGVDEFAFHRGRTHGTILIDVETRRPIDLLPDRSADTSAAWLAEHPEVEIIRRDRRRVFGEGDRRGAPQARHVADRRHLLHSLTSAVERTAHAHRACLRENVEHTVPEVRDDAVDLANARALIESPPPMDPPGNQLRPAPDNGTPTSTTCVNAATPSVRSPESSVWTARPCAASRRPTSTNSSPPRASAGAGRSTASGPISNAASTRARRTPPSCTGRSTNRDIAAAASSSPSMSRPCARVPPVPEARRVIPSPRRNTSWIMRRPENLGDNERSDPDRVLAACPDPATAHAPADDFSAITRERRGNDLPGRVTHVLADGPPPLQSYTISLQTDSEAVVNGHTLQWSSGAVEGQVNRIKFLKRRSYGRASFDLLRTLVLAQPL